MTVSRRDAWLLSIGTLLIRIACRRLPAEIREEYTREWVGELHAIVGDPDSRWWLVTATRAILFAADQQRTTLALADVEWWRLLSRPLSKVGMATAGTLAAISVMVGYGVGKYMKSGGDSGNISTAKNTMIYGVLGMLGVLVAGLIVLGPAITLVIAGGGLVLNVVSFFMIVSPKELHAVIKYAWAKKAQPDRS